MENINKFDIRVGNTNEAHISNLNGLVNYGCVINNGTTRMPAV